jgi:hypothetical protein
MPVTKLGLIAIAGTGFIATPDYRHPVEPPFARRTMHVAVPTGANHGGVDLSSYGLVVITPDRGAPMTTLHLRMRVTNEEDPSPWSVSFSRVAIELPDARIPATFINADLPTLPVAIIERRESVLADLYFAMPTRVKTDADIASFDVAWRVATTGRSPEGRIHFERAGAAAPPELVPTPELGLGQHWWFDPHYAWPTYYYRPGRATPRPPKFVVVKPLSRFETRR